MINQPKYRHRLNPEQLEVLELLHKFRFASSDLIARYFNKKNGTFVYKRIKILEEQGLVGKRYENSYRLQGRPAIYYLVPDGARKLQEIRNTDVNIKAAYKDKIASDQFIDHNLTIFKIYCDLKTLYGDRLKFFTKSELKQYEYFPDPLPDAYFRINTDDEHKQYFLEALQSTRPFFVSVNKARRYIQYQESGEWEDTDTDLPTVILACDSPTLQNRLEKQIIKLENEIDELKFHLTSSSLNKLP